MKLTVERLPESRVSLDIAADDTEFAQAVDRAARRVANQVQIPGFRKGKAPKAMIERMYGREVFVEEANRTLMTDLYRQAVSQEELVPVGEPEVEVVSADPLAFKVVTAVYPTVEPGAYQEVRVEPADAAVTEAEIDAVIENLRKDNSPWVDPPTDGMTLGPDRILTPQTRLPRDGDQVTIDVHSETLGEADSGTDEEDVVFILGESGLLDELDAAIKTLRVGETTTVQVSFGEEEERANAEVRGKTIAYRITLKALKERDLMPLDDDLARAVGDLDSLAALRDQVRGNLHREKTERLSNEGFQQILEQLLAQTTVDVPQAMVDAELHDEIHSLEHRLAQQGMSLDAYLRLAEQTHEQLEDSLRPAVSKRLQAGLLLEAIARQEDIKVPEQRFAAALNFLASPMMTGSQERSRELLRDREFLNNVQRDIRDSLVRERLIAIATEGQGIVLNAWTAPVPNMELDAEDIAEAEAAGYTVDAEGNLIGPDGEPADADVAADADVTENAANEAAAAGDPAPTEGDAAPVALDEALTTGAMPGQPGDLGEDATLTTTSADLADAAALMEEQTAPPADAGDEETPATHPTI